ncbi:hypothetical protein LPB137_00635 [Poseidonibacter parvus]|uniref:Uncharacterized protein n=1 Tax=Poseidonibacter parvus TaxID=1850254 RepID=A0A1P8KIS3_9BACT|nr:hypothetical protein [Poseidonibacter parvus]APW64442.1 hypothetical protein LPB137_00635 [Poseidonibacter parvus]
MPQLIAMVIVVVGAMIYMFQTFGGTGDKIEGIAQKSSIMTEINNIKNGLQLAARDEVLRATDSTTADKVETLEGLAELEYFADQINDELDATATTDTANVYQAISFGSGNTMEISLVLPAKANATTLARPGLFIDISKGSLATNAGFLEKQLVADLGALASIDVNQTSATYNTTIDAAGDLTTPAALVAASGTTAATDEDGKFVIYFKDLQRGVIDNQ